MKLVQMFTLEKNKGPDEYRYKFTVNINRFGFGSPGRHTFIQGYENEISQYLL